MLGRTLSKAHEAFDHIRHLALVKDTIPIGVEAASQSLNVVGDSLVAFRCVLANLKPPLLKDVQEGARSPLKGED